MPTGHAIPNMMDNEVVEFFYTCLKNVEGSINFGEVARILGLKDANSARTRMKAIITAQEKTGPRPGHGGVRRAKGDSERGVGRPAKKQKRKVSEIEENGEESDEEAAEQEDGEAPDNGESRRGIEAGENADKV